MSFDLNQDNMLKFLNKLGLAPTYQRETDQIYFLTKIREVEVPVFFGVRKESSLIQILAYLPYALKQEAFGEVARMLHLLNKQLDMPGFGMDENEQLMFFRSVVPCSNDQVDEKLLSTYIETLRLACETFMYAIGTVAAGTKTMDEMLKNG